jgi:hypothetical protein
VSEREREREKPTNKQTNKHTNKQTKNKNKREMECCKQKKSKNDLPTYILDYILCGCVYVVPTKEREKERER